MTRVEVLADGQVAGYFFTRLPVAACRKLTIPRDFRGVPGEWEPAGGIALDAAGANAWYAAAVALGEVREVSDE